jgi:hypothetical protein
MVIEKVAETEIEARFYLKGTSSVRSCGISESGGDAVVKTVVNGFVLFGGSRVLRAGGLGVEAITYLRTDIEESSMAFAAEIEVEEEGQFEVMQSA